MNDLNAGRDIVEKSCQPNESANDDTKDDKNSVAIAALEINARKTVALDQRSFPLVDVSVAQTFAEFPTQKLVARPVEWSFSALY
jgi:hypothetical protein